MNQLIRYISEFQLISLEKILDQLSKKYKADISEESGRKSVLFRNNIYISTKAKYLLTMQNNTEYTISINENSELEQSNYKTKYNLVLESHKDENDVFIKDLMNEIEELLFNTLPDYFISIEHFKEYLKEPYKLAVIEIPENLLITVESGIKEIFKDFELHGKTTDPENEVRYRLEYKDNKFINVEISSYSIFKKDDMLVAIGLEKTQGLLDKATFNLVVYLRRSSSTDISILFNNIENALWKADEIRGGKFTGDQVIIKLKEKVSFDDIVLEESIRAKIKSDIFDFFSMEKLYRKAKLPFKRGVVLYGPTGTGKTMIAKIIASVMEQTVIWVKAGDINSSKDITRIFRFARIGRPSIIVFEDIDFYIGDRESVTHDSSIIATFMSHLDGLEENDGILVVVTTNRIESIEKAVIERPGRIDSKIFMGELGRESIAALLDKKTILFTKDFDSYLDVLPGHITMTGAFVNEFASEIIRNSIMSSSAVGDNLSLTKETVLKALKYMDRLENKRVGFQ